MPEHYFSKKPQSKHSPKRWNYQLRGKEYEFMTDAGVFSRDRVDYGSCLLIEQFNEPDASGNLLDLGCGYGPIGISLANDYPNRHVVLADVNERAVYLAQENAKLNLISNIEVVQSDRFSNLANRSFAAIVTNPPVRAGKKIVHEMFEEAYAALVHQGALWVVIQKKQGAPSAKEKMISLFGEVETVAKSKGYYLFRAIKV
jgi:16S rRNA (guanine1207-N2)-methyltransferase